MRPWVEKRKVQRNPKTNLWLQWNVLYGRMWWFVPHCRAGPKNVFYHCEIGAWHPHAFAAHTDNSECFRKTWTISSAVWLARALISILYFRSYGGIFMCTRRIASDQHPMMAVVVAIAMEFFWAPLSRYRCKTRFTIYQNSVHFWFAAHNKHWKCVTLWPRSLWHVLFSTLPIWQRHSFAYVHW